MCYNYSKTFLKRLTLLGEKEIHKLNPLHSEVELIENKSKIFSLGYFYNKPNVKEFWLYFITKKYGKLEGASLKLDGTLKSRYNLTGDFAIFLYDEYSIDTTVKILSTLEYFQKSLFETLHVNIKTYSFLKDIISLPTKESLKGNLSKYVYVIKNNVTGYYKIGNSKDPFRREKTLQSQEPDINMIVLHKAHTCVETKLHRKYKDKRVRGEWFDLTIEEIKEVEKFILLETN